ncbi:MAG: NAD-dependent epimerase/dehydratase family protein, partial [Candidatus Latescibacteria bacterium]|nr:NAD-dependent epimerase/dehydratase family protein [Candidatus Latescibacterota bacterium]
MKIAVFGAEGWTGRAVLANLQDKHDVRAVVFSPESWDQWNDIDGTWPGEDVHYGDIVEFDFVHAATEDVDAIIHLAVHFPYRSELRLEDNTQSFLVNLKGLWNVL